MIQSPDHAALRLRALEPEDLELVFALENDAKTQAVTLCGQPVSRYAVRRYLEEQPTDIYACGSLRLVVEVFGNASAAPKAIGLADLSGFSPADRRAEVGIALLGAYRGRGFGLQALQALEAFAAGRLNIRTLYAFVAKTGNGPSRSIFERSGFKALATLPGWFFSQGKFADAVFYLKTF